MRVPALLIIAAAGLTAAATLATPAAADPGSDTRFIITVADAYDSRQVAAEHRRNGAEIDFVYTAALNGFAGAMSDAEMGALQRDRRVTRIERDGVATASEVQTDATWGLDRIDARSGLDATYTYATDGSGVNAYVIDTGIELGHVDFGRRAVSGYDAIDGGTADDCNGHGTHVAGTVGGATWGVAKNASLHAVRVLDCNGSGSWSQVIAGLDWVTANHVKPAVANMSLGGGASSSVDDAVKRTIDAGVPVVVAAGNGNLLGIAEDACKSSPARVPAALTIGATTDRDAKTSWSNYGSCVDLFAPGASITSAWHTSTTATNTISGTSMAAPHVAGVAALYLHANPSATPAAVGQAIYDGSTKGIVTSSSTANNHLLYSRLTTTTPPANTGPTAGFTSSCTDLTCTFTSTSTDAEDTTLAHAWAFGDGGTSTATSPTHTYGAADTYAVTLTVTDSAGATSTATQNVTVTAPSGISLSASGYKVKGTKKVDLAWSGATSSIDVYRDGLEIVSATTNDGAHTDTINSKGGGSYTYKICEADTDTCSNTVTVTF